MSLIKTGCKQSFRSKVEFLINIKLSQVSASEGVGRFLVATRDIRPLELVLWDKVNADKIIFPL